MSTPIHPRNGGLTRIAGLLTLLALLGGCATSSVVSLPVSREPATSAQSAPEFVPIARYGRYTLVELVPEPAQRDLLQQVVEVAIPPTFDASVGDAMRHVLLRSGYWLCDSADASALYALSLPAAHFHLGPLALRDALLTLSGPAWDLSVDDAVRQVCFRRQTAPVNPTAVPANAAPSEAQANAGEARKDQP